MLNSRNRNMRPWRRYNDYRLGGRRKARRFGAGRRSRWQTAANWSRRRRVWVFQVQRGYMGMPFDLPFYSARHMPGKTLDLPFGEEQPFSCLIHAATHMSDDAFRELAQNLLSRNMRYCMLSGIESERLAGILDEMLETGDYHHEGQQALASACEEEPFEEALEYFMLPSDLAPVNMLLVVGDEDNFQQAIDSAGRIVDTLQMELAG